MGYLASTGNLSPEAMRTAVVFGSAMASFNVEDFSFRRLARLTYAELADRFREFKSLDPVRGGPVEGRRPAGRKVRKSTTGSGRSPGQGLADGVLQGAEVRRLDEVPVGTAGRIASSE